MVLREINKLILGLLISIMITSCQMTDQHNLNSSGSGMARKEMKDDLLQQMTRDIFYQDSIMRQINAELNRIDAMYMAYEGGIEGNGRNQNRGREIINRIKHLNRLLENTRAELRKSSLDNKGFLDMISRFEKELEQKERKITELQNTVSEQEKVILQQTETIVELEDINRERARQLQVLEKEMNSLKSEAYNDLADLLVRIAEEMPEVRGIFTRRTREEVELLQQKLILDAYRHYEEAAGMGSNYASGRQNELETEYTFVR